MFGLWLGSWLQERGQIQHSSVVWTCFRDRCVTELERVSEDIHWPNLEQQNLEGVNCDTRPVRFIKRWKHNGAKLEAELGQSVSHKKWGSVPLWHRFETNVYRNCGRPSTNGSATDGHVSKSRSFCCGNKFSHASKS